MYLIHLRPMNPKRVTEESLLEEFENVLANKNRVQNTVRSGIHDIACTGNNLLSVETMSFK